MVAITVHCKVFFMNLKLMLASVNFNFVKATFAYFSFNS